MERLFSFASWNIENFTGKQERFDRVVDTLNRNGPPDVFGIFEVRSSTTVFQEFTSRIPSHQFFITVTARSPIDTLVGINRNFTAFYEQRDELNSGLPSLRPGALVTLRLNGQTYTILFVHLKAFAKPIGWGLRDDMIEHIRNLKKTLDSLSTGDANFIALGDFNSVGMDITYSDKDIKGDEELSRYKEIFDVRNMSLVPKDRNATLWGGPGSAYPPSDVDHAFASNHLNIRHGVADQDMGMSVKGWPELGTDEERGQWINQLSDHAMIYGEVHS